MYLNYYNLDEKPFQISTDPKYLWLGEKHKEALAVLKYGVLDNRGFLLLTGDVGTGKTTIINTLLKELKNKIIVAKVSDPGMERLDFYNFIAHGFKFKRKFDSKSSFLLAFGEFLSNAHKNGKRVLLIIDEAQRLNHEILEEIRLLSNIEKENTKLLNIFFVGQNDFNKILWESRNRALRQRITVNYYIDPLTEKETGHYIFHRLSVAGATQKLFSAGAISEVYKFSLGFPRLINIICDHALLTGYVTENKIIRKDVIVECARELKIPKKKIAYDDLGESKEQFEFSDTQHVDTTYTSPSEVNDHYRLRNTLNQWLNGNWVVSVILFSIVLFIAGCFLYLGKYNASEKRMHRMWDRLLGNPATATSDNIENQSHEVTENENVASASVDIDSAELKAGKREIVPKKRLRIVFSHNSNEFSPDALVVLERIVGILNDNPSAKINVLGYTDSYGHPEYNKNLSTFRANKVKKYLLDNGIADSRIEAIGKGSEDPIADNGTFLGRKANRRVEVEFIL